MAFVLRLSASESRKKSEYEDMEDVEADETTESGEEEREVSELCEKNLFSRGKSTAMVPPKVGRLLLPHMVVMMDDRKSGLYRFMPKKEHDKPNIIIH